MTGESRRLEPMLEGACHCGALTIQFETTHAPAELPVRICGCTFCRKHRPRYTSDPTGHVRIGIASEEAVSRHRFGLRLADFLVCRACGVFVAAYEPGEPGRAVVNVEALTRADEFVAEPTRFQAYDTETGAERLARRARAWTPATVALRG
jgi:hypothetical protein